MPLFITSALTWLFNSVILKAIVLFVVYAVVSSMSGYMFNILAGSVSTTSIQNSISYLPSGVIYFLALFRFDYGLPLILTAFIGRFIIRRLPVIG